MVKNRKWLLISTILFTTVAMLISSVAQRQHDVIMEMILFPLSVGGDGVVAPIYSFVVKSDGTLIARYGISRRNIDVTRNHNMGFTLISISHIFDEEEFQNISETLMQIAYIYDHDIWTVMGAQRALILYDGHIYMRAGICVSSFETLLDKFIQRSPFRPSFIVF